MKLLLCIATLADIQPVFEKFPATPQSTAAKFISITSILHHEVTIVETGHGSFQTAYKMTKALGIQKYHLALKIGTGNAYKSEIAVGSVLNIVNEKPGDFGMNTGDGWKDLYDLGLLTNADEPQQRGGFINLNNAYMNIFAPFKKAVGLTVNNYADKSMVTDRVAKYKADCETADGLGFVYPCLYEKQSYYHLCIPKRNLATGEENKKLAKEKLNEVLTDLLQKL